MSDRYTAAYILKEHGTNNINTYNTYLSGNSLFQTLQPRHFQQETALLLQKIWQNKIRLLYKIL
jgi:hypothetical protein